MRRPARYKRALPDPHERTATRTTARESLAGGSRSRSRRRRCRRTDTAKTGLLRSASSETAGLDLGGSALFFLWRNRRHVGGDRVRRGPVSPCRSFARDECWSCTRSHVDFGYRRSGSFANSSDHGSGPSASLSQHAARFQTSFRHVDGRVDSDRIWHVRGSGFDRTRSARASDFSRHAGSTPALGYWDLHFWCGNFWNFACDLYGSAHWSNGDPRVVSTSHLAAHSFWNRWIGIRDRVARIARSSHRA